MTIAARFAPVLLALTTVFATGCNQTELDGVDLSVETAWDDNGETGDDAASGEDEGADEDSDSGFAFQDSDGAPSFCGDAELNSAAEECDEGENNDDNGACTTKCTINVCGDGLVYEGVEECDGAGDYGPGAYCNDECLIVAPE